MIVGALIGVGYNNAVLFYVDVSWSFQHELKYLNKLSRDCHETLQP